MSQQLQSLRQVKGRLWKAHGLKEEPIDAIPLQTAAQQYQLIIQGYEIRFGKWHASASLQMQNASEPSWYIANNAAVYKAPSEKLFIYIYLGANNLQAVLLE